jgi:hypothetical protein
MLRRSVLAAFSLGLGILTLCPRSLAHGPAAQNDTQKPAQAPPAKQGDKSAGLSSEEQVYERAKATLSKYIEQVNAREGQLKQILGKEYSTDLAGTFSEFRASLQQQLKDLETRHQEALKTKDQDCDDCSAAYLAAIRDGIRVQQNGGNYDPSWLNEAMDALSDQESRSKDILRKEYEKRKADLDKNPNSPDELYKQLDKYESEQAKKIFDDLAHKIQAYVRVLSEERKENIQELWRWYDFASQLKKSDEDAHATGVRYADEMLAYYRSYVDGRGKAVLPERDLNTGYGGYSWCKPSLYPDVQEREEGRQGILSTALVAQPSVDSLRPPKESAAASSPTTGGAAVATSIALALRGD